MHFRDMRCGLGHVGEDAGRILFPDGGQTALKIGGAPEGVEGLVDAAVELQLGKETAADDRPAEQRKNGQHDRDGMGDEVALVPEMHDAHE